jgi:mannosyltransferase OCH1-like enzyme
MLRICTVDELKDRIKSKQLVCFGAGDWTNATAKETHDFDGIFDRISYFVDNNPKLHEAEKLLGDKAYRIRSKQFLLANADENTVVLLTCGSKLALEIFDELNSENCRCDIYIANMIRNHTSAIKCRLIDNVPDGFRMNESPVIPKKIHYSWFSGEPIPDKNRHWMESWSKHNPDYEIIEWNSRNYDLSKHPYMKAAYQTKSWGFIADYARLDIVYEHGGIYLDVDVEVVKSFDELLYNNAFVGFYNTEMVNFGSGFGSRPGFPLLKAIRDSYDNYTFNAEEGTDKMIASPALQTSFLTNRGMVIDGKFQVFEGLTLYPPQYFDPFDLTTGSLSISENTFSAHYYDGSWTSDDHKSNILEIRTLYNKMRENELIYRK